MSTEEPAGSESRDASAEGGAALPPAGWYPDPQGPGSRWWDGEHWTDQYLRQPPAGRAPGTLGGYDGQQAPGYGPYRDDGRGAWSAGRAPIGAWRSAVDDRPPVSGIGGATRAVFGKYAQFAGRAGRPEFWFWVLFCAIVNVAAFIVFLLLDVLAVAVGSVPIVFAGIIGVALLLWGLAIIVPTVAVTVRRLRDGGFHWALLFLQLVPGGGIVILILCCLPSKYE
ncbi:MAG TPA: DUF805 domain-containing protein [Microbacteriaceae bacterium]|nr:DUF805 domain-containing protein [Microbacteriaceae bacterium]